MKELRGVEAITAPSQYSNSPRKKTKARIASITGALEGEGGGKEKDRRHTLNTLLFLQPDKERESPRSFHMRSRLV